MPLKITLKPNERLIINGASIRNGDRSATFVMETQCRFLRESEIIKEADANTVSRRLCVTLQAIYVSDPADRYVFDGILLGQMKAIVEAAPTAAPFIADIGELLGANLHHKAIKRCKELVAYEDSLIQRARMAA